MLDSNPEQTRKDNIAKLQKQITEVFFFLFPFCFFVLRAIK